MARTSSAAAVRCRVRCHWRRVSTPNTTATTTAMALASAATIEGEVTALLTTGREVHHGRRDERAEQARGREGALSAPGGLPRAHGRGCGAGSVGVAARVVVRGVAAG